MDEASGIIAELQHRLSQLDHKVWLYRQTMTTEFSKYTQDLLRGLSDDLGQTVSKALEESLKSYPSLYPEGANVQDLTVEAQNGSSGQLELPREPTAEAPTVTCEESLSTPAGDMAATEPERPRSPHEREREFRGVFTPSFLPLVDFSDRHERRSSSEKATPSDPQSNARESTEEDELPAKSSSDASSKESSASGSPTSQNRKPSTPSRQNTDSSVFSDNSDSPRPRSALRRTSSSASKAHSPRRVRFAFEDSKEEFATTSSPSIPHHEELEHRAPIILGYIDDSDDEPGSAFCEDISEPPPKRVSSSQALRALSRTAVDDGTQWTVSTPDEPLRSADCLRTSQDDTELSSQHAEKTNGQSLERVAEQPQEANDDDDPVFMRPPTMSTSRPLYSEPHPPTEPIAPRVSAAESAPVLPPRPTRLSLDVKNPTSTSKDPDLTFGEDEDDVLFAFDEGEDHHATGISKHEEESPTDPAPTTAVLPPTIQSKSHLSNAISSSPARDILRQGKHNSSLQPADASYKGSLSRSHPFNDPIVSPKIHAQAAEMGPMSSFVGSVDGRSGYDDFDTRGFRASGAGGYGSFRDGTAGTPRSFSERMILEDMGKLDELD